MPFRSWFSLLLWGAACRAPTTRCHSEALSRGPSPARRERGDRQVGGRATPARPGPVEGRAGDRLSMSGPGVLPTVHCPLSTTHYALYPSLIVARPTISLSLCAPTSLSSISWWEETPYTHLSRYAGMRPRRVEATTSITWGMSEE